VIAQVQVPEDTGEITQVPALLDPVDLTNVVVTADALCRHRHKASYADLWIMPMFSPKTLVAAVFAALRRASSEDLQKVSRGVEGTVSPRFDGRPCQGPLSGSRVNMQVDRGGWSRRLITSYRCLRPSERDPTKEISLTQPGLCRLSSFIHPFWPGQTVDVLCPIGIIQRSA